MDIRKLFKKMSDSTFDRAFIEKREKNESEIKASSDSDSAAEAEIAQEKKRARKRKRRAPKQKKPNSTFKIKTAPPRVRVTAENAPVILEIAEELHRESPEQIVAEHVFFNKKNQDSFTKDAQDWIKPQDFPSIRALIQKKPSPTFDIHLFNDRERLRNTLQVVTRKYEESFLREKYPHERACAMGNKCEGLNIVMANDKGFILVEFLLPSEKEEYDKTGKFPSENRLCLMCNRAHIARAYINIRADGMGAKEDAVLPDYRNLVEVPGEYCLKDCIVSSRDVYEGILDPIVLHVRTGYRVVERNGHRFYEQWRMSYPSEEKHFLFQAPSH
jgi:hypothetical protein